MHAAGVVKLGVQFTLFVAMLFLLLSAQQDPLQQAVRILPMSETAREHTAASFSDALRGVFQSALKLAVFHAVFTWLTFRAFSIQLVYVSTVASAVCSILPLVQVWMVAIPAALQLLVQVPHDTFWLATFRVLQGMTAACNPMPAACATPGNSFLLIEHPVSRGHTLLENIHMLGRSHIGHAMR